MIAAMRAPVVLGLVLGCGSSATGPDAAVTTTVDAAAVTAPDSPNAADLPAAADTAPAVDPALAAQARAIAGEYQSWGRIDDELRWAPWLCRIPLPGLARMSTSSDSATHGQKLYSVFVKKRDAYPMGPHTDQVVVKESWTSERVTDPSVMYDPERSRYSPDAGDHFYPYAMKDGMIYRAAARAGLYIMFKLDGATPNSDGGWVYATITADGQLTAAGKIQSCVACHQEAEHDRLFGVPKAP
jgi:hypothetical protein